MIEPLVENRVILKGKVNRVGGLKYTPMGTSLCEFSLAVPQRYFEERSVGYFDVMLTGSLAEENAGRLRVGKVFEVRGNLWGRRFRDKKGRIVNETKVIVDFIEGEK